MTIFDVRIDNISLAQAKKRVLDFLHSQQLHTVWTPNPEMLVAARKQEHFKKILNQGDLNLCDGSGISLLSAKRIARIHGSDFMLHVCEQAAKEGVSVYLLGGTDRNVLERAAQSLQQKFPTLQIAGMHCGPRIDDTDAAQVLDGDVNDDVLKDITDTRPVVLFVGFGHTKQETWIMRHAMQLTSVRVAMGVGGTLDMLGGKTKRAPKIIRFLHLEWLWRLCLEPKRIKRIWTAVVVFPILYLLYK